MKITVLFLFVIQLSLLSFAQTNGSWPANAIIYQVNIRQYSTHSQISAVTKDLDRIKSLGFNTIQLMPIHPIGLDKRIGRLGSPYSISNYSQFNPEFGTALDFESFMREAHLRGIKVILDWVANHTSWDNIWTSTQRQFYKQAPNGDFVPPIPDWQDVIALNYSNPNLENEMIRVMQSWIDLYDIDGFRFDASHLVPNSFWLKARSQLKTNKPFLWLGESTEISQLDCCFDSLYSFEYNLLIKGIAQGRNQPYELWQYLKNKEIPFLKTTHRLIHYTSNHDENAWSGTDQENFGPALRPTLALNYFLPGIPFIYNGQEIGLKKRLQFFDQDPINWQEVNQELYAFIVKLNHIKSSYAGFINNPTQLEGTACHHPNAVLILKRNSNNKDSFGVFNFSNAIQSISKECFFGKLTQKQMIDAFTNETINFQNIKLKPWGFYLIIESPESTKE